MLRRPPQAYSLQRLSSATMAAFHRIVRQETITDTSVRAGADFDSLQVDDNMPPLCCVPLAERCPLVYPNECYDNDRDKHNEETFGEEHYPDEEWRDVCRRARVYRLQDAQLGEYIAINRGCQQEVAERAFENEMPMLSDIWNYYIPQEEYEYWEEAYEKKLITCSDHRDKNSNSDSDSESDNGFYEEAFDAMYAIDEERARQEREEEEFWEEMARIEEEEARRYHEEQLEIEEQNRWVAFEEDDGPMTRGEELEAEEEMRIRDREQRRLRLERWP